MTRKPTTARKRRDPRTIRFQRWMTRIATAGMIPVAAVALWTSYWHIQAVTVEAGESTSTSYIMAFSVDGLMLVASVAIMSGRRSVFPYSAFITGLAASLAANMVSADGSPVSYIVAAWPAVSLFFASEVLLRLVAPAKRKPRARTATAKATARTRRAARKPAGAPAPLHAVPAAA